MLRRGRRYLELSTPVRREVGIRFLGRPEISGVSEFRADAECLFFQPPPGDDRPSDAADRHRPFRMMEQWADINTEVRKKFDQPVDCGWNSWDYYRWTISEEEVLRNAEFIARDPVLSKRIKRIIVDDGWQYCYGEWQANPRFPNGMRYLAAELAKMGFEPGLWFAPSIVEPHARIAQLDSDLLALSDGGQPCLAYECMRRYGFVLDPTVPASRKFVRDLFDEYAGDGVQVLQARLPRIHLESQAVPRPERAALGDHPTHRRIGLGGDRGACLHPRLQLLLRGGEPFRGRGPDRRGHPLLLAESAHQRRLGGRPLLEQPALVDQRSRFCAGTGARHQRRSRT